MQATMRKGKAPKSVDLYLKSSADFANKDEAMTLSLAIPATVSPGPSLGASGTTANTKDVVTGITGLVPGFLVNNFAASQREVYITKEKIKGEDYYVYAFIFATTATNNHSWKAGVEQLIFSIQLNGCVSDCDPLNVSLVNLPDGGAESRAYWYFQPNTLGDITNYQSPFYGNEETADPINGGSGDGSALSMLSLSGSLNLPIKLNSFNVIEKDCMATVNWISSEESNLMYYSIERSNNGIDFFEVGKLNPANNSLPEKSYSFQDNAPDSKILFYRLKGVDKDGKYSYSKIARQAFSCIANSGISLYPARSTGLFNYRIEPVFEKVMINVVNASGQIILKTMPGGLTGKLDLGNYSDGIYLVQFISGNHIIESKKVIVAR